MNTVPMFMGKSGAGGDDVQFPVDINEVKQYSDSHEGIATDEEAARKIIDFFVAIAEGDK